MARDFIREESGNALAWLAIVAACCVCMAAAHINLTPPDLTQKVAEVRSPDLVYDNSGQVQGIQGGNPPQYVWLTK